MVTTVDLISGGPAAAIAQYLATATLAPAAALTADAPFTLAPELNNAGVTFTVFKVNPTDTASASGSLLADFQVGGSTKASISKAGLITGQYISVTTGGSGFRLIEVNGGGNRYIGTGGSNFMNIGAGLAVDISGGTGIYLGAAALNWQSSFSAGGSNIDLSLCRDAANTLGLRNATAQQAFNLYGTYASASDYHRSKRSVAKATLSGVSGASVTATGLIPAGVRLIGISTKVTTGLGETNGTTGYAVGTGADPNLWGDVVGVAAGTSSDGTDATADPAGTWSASARDVIATAAGGNFDGTGVIELYAHYDTVEAD